jgi:serine protease Do
MTRRRLGRALGALALVLALASGVDARTWSWLGVRIRDLTEQEMDELATRHGIREGFGVVIVEVLEGTPAARAGFKNGDIVVAVGARPVTETRLLQRLIGAAPVGVDTEMTVLRAEGRERLVARLVAMPPALAGERVAAEYGFVIREPDPGPETLGRRPAPGVGVPSVAVVVRGSSAAEAGLAVGDVILQVGEQPVASREAAGEALAETEANAPLRLAVRRGERRLVVTLPPPRRTP